MKTLKRNSAILMLLAFTFFGCRPDSIKPKKGLATTPAHNENFHGVDETVCGESVTYPLYGEIYGAMSEVGSLELVNGREYMYLITKANPGMVVIKTWAWAGHDLGDIPADSDGNPNKEAFPNIKPVNPSAPVATVKIPLAELADMNGYCLFAEMAALGADGTPMFSTLAATDGDVDGKRGYNTHIIKQCDGGDPMNGDPIGAHATAQIDVPTCVGIYKGYGPAECAELQPAIDLADAPHTFLWDSGETSESLNVCPNESTTYSVDVTNVKGITRTYRFDVNVLDIREDPTNPKSKKVKICHVPPGNPANEHTIVISRNGAPAHVDPSLGHNSGCRLGPCDVTICQD